MACCAVSCLRCRAAVRSNCLPRLFAPCPQASIRNVGIHNLSPGMVTTELLMSGANTPVAKFFINCLGKWTGLAEPMSTGKPLQRAQVALRS